jgi:ATP-dependent Lon protease
VRHLILRSDVVKAVGEGTFHIYPVKSIDEGLVILTNRPADGGAGKESVNDAVAKRLKELAVGLKEFAALEKMARRTLTRKFSRPLIALEFNKQ